MAPGDVGPAGGMVDIGTLHWGTSVAGHVGLGVTAFGAY